MALIFLCHASEDRRKVQEIYGHLRELGFQPWMDKINLLPGQDWDREIRSALHASDFILIFFSRNSVAKRGYVQREFKLVLDTLEEIPERNIHTIPIRLDDCDVPEQFRALQWANLFEDDGFERIVQSLQEGISQRQQPESNTSASSTDEDQQEDNARDKETKTSIAYEINKEAMNICAEINRYDYKNYYNRQILHDFCQKINLHHKTILPEDELNANCHLILGLDFVVRNMFNMALDELQKAGRKARLYANKGASEFLYPGRNPNEIKDWNKKLANISLFHEAIIRYKLGEYSHSVALFREALEYDETDAQSILYIPEAEYLGCLDNFENIIDNFERARNRIETIDDIRMGRESKESVLSQLFIRYGNCYYPGCNYEPYRVYENLEIAEEAYKKSYDYRRNSYAAKFSYAQVLKLKYYKSNSEVERKEVIMKSNELFNEVFDVVKIMIGQSSEVTISIMLYYILAICCKEAMINGENPKVYIMEIYRRVGKLPPFKWFRIFSPLTKNDLTYEELIEELRVFEKNL